MTDELAGRESLRRQMTELAVRLARNERWEEAVRVNEAIVEAFPNDVEAHNRLGKALLELGRYKEAREAYAKALELDPNNVIARRNLSRLAILEAEGRPKGAKRARKLPPDMFIEETGKTGITTLLRPNRELAAQLSAGDEVFLRPKEDSLVVEWPEGHYLGEVEPRLAQRLLRLMQGGNRYVAAVSQITDTGDVRVFIREVYQDPSQAGKLSFPPETEGEPFRPYVRPTLVYHAEGEPILDEELLEEAEEGEWERARNRLADAEQLGLDLADVAEPEDEEAPDDELV
jgi:tetratricopeptide (TPR) repeat protein